MQDMLAQSLRGYKEVNLKEEFTDNAFTFFSHAPILLSGDKTEHNAMTIGWGSLGNNYLGYNRLTVSVYVAPGALPTRVHGALSAFTIHGV